MQEAVGILQEIPGSRDYRYGHESHVSFDAYGAYSLHIELWYTSKTGYYFEAKRERDEMNREILRIARAWGCPTRASHDAIT